MTLQSVMTHARGTLVNRSPYMTQTNKRAGRARSGYLYVAVLMSALAVSTMGLVAISTAALRLRSSTATNDWTAAQLLAQSAIEDALLTIQGDNGWRTAFTHGVEYPASPRTLGNGTFTWKLVDDDGSLSDDDSDSVRVVGIGRVGEARVAESVRLLPTGQALTCLESALHVAGNISLGSAVGLRTDQRLSCNGNISASGFLSSITGNVEASGTITGTVNGTKTSPVAARRMPGSSAFDYYLDNGTYISLASLPVVSGVPTIEKTVLAPQQNVYGPARNPEGIYVLDCQGARVAIQNCRIVGTIVLLNPAANSSIDGTVRWDAAVANYPALLVSGSIEMKTSPGDLSETVLTTNFNPPGVPYSGIEDSDLLDAYPCEIKGLVYVSGTLSAPQDLQESPFRGATICTAITANSSCVFNYRPLLLAAPPPGFAKGNPMKVSPGSRRRESL